MTWAGLVGKTQKYLIDHSPEILTGAAVVGTVLTAALTGKAAVKAYQIIEEDEFRVANDDDPRAEMKRTVDLVWREFIPPATTALATITCIIAANRIGASRYAGLVAASAIAERRFTEYRDKVVEKLGDKRERGVREELAQDRVDRDPPREVIIASGGDVLFRDEQSGRYFESDIETVKKAMNDTNYQINNDFYASLSDFYNRIGLAPTKHSEEVGWNSDRLMDIQFAAAVSTDGRPCITIDFTVVPTRGYYRCS